MQQGGLPGGGRQSQIPKLEIVRVFQKREPRTKIKGQEGAAEKSSMAAARGVRADVASDVPGRGWAGAKCTGYRDRETSCQLNST